MMRRGEATQLSFLFVVSFVSLTTLTASSDSDSPPPFFPVPRDVRPPLDDAGKAFWQIPISETDECNIETIECRARGVHWEASPPIFILVFRSGEAERTHDLLKSCTPKGSNGHGGINAEGREGRDVSSRAGQLRRFFVLTSASAEEARSVVVEGHEVDVTFVAVNDTLLSSPPDLVDTIVTVIRNHIPSSTKRVFLLNAQCSHAIDAMADAVSYANPLLTAVGGGAVGGVERSVLAMLEAMREEAELVEVGSEWPGMEGVLAMGDTYVRETAGGGSAKEHAAGHGEGAKRGAGEGEGEGWAGEGAGGGQEVVVASVVFSQPRMLQYQLRTFKRFLRPAAPPPRFLAIVDSQDPALRASFAAVCAEEGAECLATPYPSHSHGTRASWLHGQALDWAWEEVLLPRFPSALLFITEQDVFLLAPFHLLLALDPAHSAPPPRRAPPDHPEAPHADAGAGGGCRARCSMGGVSQVRSNGEGWRVEYLHPSAIVIDLRRLPMAAAARFSPTEFNGTELDTGGGLAVYWEAVREVEAEEGEGGGEPGRCLRVCRLSHRYMGEETCFGAAKAELGLPDLYAEGVLHAQRSSGWDIRGARESGRDAGEAEALGRAHAARGDCLWATLDAALQVL